MTTQILQTDVPPGFSLPEFLVFRELERVGLVEGVDFTFQSPFQGGRLEKGGAIIDFLFSNPPNLAISVLGEFFHYELGVEVGARDLLQREQLAGEGITLIFIDEEDVLRDARFFVSEALQFRDLSKRAGR